MAALIAKLERLAGDFDIHTRIGWGCAAGSILVVLLIHWRVL